MSDDGREIDLASLPDFQIGGLNVSPSACQVHTTGGETQRIEPKVMEVLVVLREAEGRTVTRDQLIARCWEGRAVSDDAVTRVIARLRALGRGAEPPHFTLETIPKVGFRLTVSAPAAVPATPSLFTPDRKLIAAAVGALALLIGGIWFAIGVPPSANVIPDRIAIVAFATMGPEAELVTLARKAQEAAVQRLTETGMPAAAIAPGGAPPAEAELRLQGGIERDGGEYVVRATLVHPSGLALWSGRFARAPADLLGLEEEAAYTIAGGLACAVNKRVAALWQPSKEALLPLLFEICFTSGVPDVERKIAAARRLVEAAPDLAFAHGRLALALAEQAIGFAHHPDQTNALAAAAVDTANKALALDDDVAAHLALGVRGSRRSLAERERHLKKALELEPHNVVAIQYYNQFLLEVGRIAAGREILARTERWPATAFYRAQIDAMNGDRIGAEQQLDQLALVRPAWARDGRWIITAFWEDPRTAIAKLPALARGQPSSGDECVIAHVKALAQSDGRLKALPAACANLPVDWRVRLLARQGDVEGAFALLEGPWPLNRPHWFLFYPEMKSVRADPRFRALVERLQLWAYWRETTQWPDFCNESGLQYACG